MTSRTWKEAQDISWPTISRYTSLRRAVALRSASRLSERAPSPPRFLEEGRTHVLTANLGATFFQAVLDVFLFVALVVPQPSNEVVKRLFEPGRLSASASRFGVSSFELEGWPGAEVDEHGNDGRAVPSSKSGLGNAGEGSVVEYRRRGGGCSLWRNRIHLVPPTAQFSKEAVSRCLDWMRLAPSPYAASWSSGGITADVTVARHSSHSRPSQPSRRRG